MNDQLLREAKILAAQTGGTLSAFVEQAVRERLKKLSDAAANDRRPMLFFPHAPGMLVNVDMNSNAQVSELLDELDEIDRRERADKRREA